MLYITILCNCATFQGGQYILELVDYYGGTFMRLFAAITETIGVFWIYGKRVFQDDLLFRRTIFSFNDFVHFALFPGLENLCIDIEFMLGIKTSFYWRICWSIVTPALMIAVFMYALVTTEALIFGDGYVYPSGAYGMLIRYLNFFIVIVSSLSLK